VTGPPAEGSRVDWADVPEQVRTEIERACGAPVVDAVTAPGGFSPGLAARIVCGDGRRWFVKAASPGLPTVRAFQAAQGEVTRRWLAQLL
jgi:hypothetical protein